MILRIKHINQLENKYRIKNQQKNNKIATRGISLEKCEKTRGQNYKKNNKKNGVGVLCHSFISISPAYLIVEFKDSDTVIGGLNIVITASFAVTNEKETNDYPENEKSRHSIRQVLTWFLSTTHS